MLFSLGDLKASVMIDGDIFTDVDADGYPQFPRLEIVNNILTQVHWNFTNKKTNLTVIIGKSTLVLNS